VLHEFTVIPHAKEDVTEFLLNVKMLRLKSLTGHSGKLTLEAEGEGKVCAADIKPSTDFEIANPELCLVTLNTPDAKLFIEFDVEIGEGYRTAESNENLQAGTIPMDAVFTPIVKVNYSTEPVHVGREISQERLYLDVWTDGTTTPSDAVSQAAAILVEQFIPFSEFTKTAEAKIEEQAVRTTIPDEKYNLPVEQLDLSVRTMNCLRRSGITSVGELVSKKPKELLKLRNFGQKSYEEIVEKLKVIDLALAPDDEVKETRKSKAKAAKPEEGTEEEKLTE
jgi:DNA-directed RNA polymerase subunit alpha